MISCRSEDACTPYKYGVTKTRPPAFNKYVEGASQRGMAVEREPIGEDEPPRSIEVAVEYVAQGDMERLERLLGGIVHTVLASYRVGGNQRLRRHATQRRRRGRLPQLCCFDGGN